MSALVALSVCTLSYIRVITSVFTKTPARMGHQSVMSQENNMRPEISVPSLAFVRIHRAKLSIGGASGESDDPRLQMTVSLRKVTEEGALVAFDEVDPTRYHINTWMAFRRTQWEDGTRVFIESWAEAEERFAKRLIPLSMALRLPKFPGGRFETCADYTEALIKYMVGHIQANLDKRVPMGFLCKGVTTMVAQPRMVDLAPAHDGTPRRELRTPRFAHTPFIDMDNTYYYLDKVRADTKARNEAPKEERQLPWGQRTDEVSDIDEVTDADRE